MSRPSRDEIYWDWYLEIEGEEHRNLFDHCLRLLSFVDRRHERRDGVHIWVPGVTYWFYELYYRFIYSIYAAFEAALYYLHEFAGGPGPDDLGFPRPHDFHLEYYAFADAWASEVPWYDALESLRFLLELSEDEPVEDAQLEPFAMTLQEQLIAFSEELEGALQYWQELYSPLLGTISRISDAVYHTMSPYHSWFCQFDENGRVTFTFRDPTGETEPSKQIIPTSSEADQITNLEVPLGVRNLYDLICFSTKVILTYLGAQTFPRGWYPPAQEEVQEPPQWQITNLSDHLAEIHQDLRDMSLVRTQVRTGPGESDVEEVTASLPEAIGLLAGAVSEISLDCQRGHILAAQAAKTAQTICAQIGTRVFPATIDLGWRGNVYAPATDSGSIAQALSAIEMQLNAISLALGIAPRPPQQ